MSNSWRRLCADVQNKRLSLAWGRCLGDSAEGNTAKIKKIQPKQSKIVRNNEQEHMGKQNERNEIENINIFRNSGQP